ncbi:MAG: hypothetical protein WC608_01890 [Parcubacteria group bacterium]
MKKYLVFYLLVLCIFVSGCSKNELSCKNTTGEITMTVKNIQLFSTITDLKNIDVRDFNGYKIEFGERLPGMDFFYCNGNKISEIYVGHDKIGAPLLLYALAHPDKKYEISFTELTSPDGKRYFLASRISIRDIK